jgi:hypothetical protein
MSLLAIFVIALAVLVLLKMWGFTTHRKSAVVWDCGIDGCKLRARANHRH